VNSQEEAEGTCPCNSRRWEEGRQGGVKEEQKERAKQTGLPRGSNNVLPSQTI